MNLITGLTRLDGQGHDADAVVDAEGCGIHERGDFEVTGNRQRTLLRVAYFNFALEFDVGYCAVNQSRKFVNENAFLTAL